MDVHFRLKINLNPTAHKVFEHGYHTDLPIVSNTALFYLNTNDGYTAFETGTKVDSIDGHSIFNKNENSILQILKNEYQGLIEKY